MLRLQTRNLLSEDEDVLNYFLAQLPKCHSIYDICEYLQAHYYERKIRLSSKEKIINKLDKWTEEKLQNIKTAENMAKRLHFEVNLHKKLNEIKNLRHAGLYTENKRVLQTISNRDDMDEEDDSGLYDWIFDIDLISNIASIGWPVIFSKSFLQSTNLAAMRSVVCNQDENQDNSKKGVSWEGAIVAVVGLYDKGKTFVLNNLSNSNLPSGKKVNTKGLSFKYVDVDTGTKLILLDTAGSYSPVKVEDNMSIIEREATEHFVLELVFDIADYFVFVVNDFTSLDQRFLDKLSRALQSSPSKPFREVIVVHNFKEVESQEILDHIWNVQVRDIYSEGSIQSTLVAAKNPINGKLEERKVNWFKSPFTRHVCLVNQDSELGLNQNPWAFSILRYWLKSVLVPYNREFSVVDNVINFSNKKLSQYFKMDITLTLQNTQDEKIKRIVCDQNFIEPLQIPQISIDSSGFVMTRPDAFLPNVGEL